MLHDLKLLFFIACLLLLDRYVLSGLRGTSKKWKSSGCPQIPARDSNSLKAASANCWVDLEAILPISAFTVPVHPGSAPTVIP